MAMTPPTISIEPANPQDVPPGDLSGFVEELQRALPEYAVEGLAGRAMRPGARGTTWWEVVRVYLPELGTDARAYVVGKALEVGYHWAKGYFKQRRNKRPKAVIVRGPDGSDLESMVLKSPRHKPRTKEEAVQPPAPPRRRKKKKQPGRRKKK